VGGTRRRPLLLLFAPPRVEARIAKKGRNSTAVSIFFNAGFLDIHAIMVVIVAEVIRFVGRSCKRLFPPAPNESEFSKYVFKILFFLFFPQQYVLPECVGGTRRRPLLLLLAPPRVEARNMGPARASQKKHGLAITAGPPH
jgi:hypothetical protein